MAAKVIPKTWQTFQMMMCSTWRIMPLHQVLYGLNIYLKNNSVSLHAIGFKCNEMQHGQVYIILLYFNAIQARGVFRDPKGLCP